MKYTDLYETKKEQFEDELTREVMDVIVLYQVAGVRKTNINNIMDELRKSDYAVDSETLIEIIEKIGYTVTDDILQLDNEEEEVELNDENPDEEYDEVGDMAKTATDKRVK